MEENVVETKVDTNVQKELTEDDLVKAYLGKDAEKLMSSISVEHLASSAKSCPRHAYTGTAKSFH